MIISSQQSMDGSCYWLAEQRIDGRVFLAEGATIHGAMAAMYMLVSDMGRRQMSIEEAAEMMGYSRCMMDWEYGADVLASNPYPIKSPEYRGWQKATSEIAIRMRRQA